MTKVITLENAMYINGYMAPIEYKLEIDENNIIVGIPEDQKEAWKDWTENAKKGKKKIDLMKRWLGQKLEGTVILPVWR